MKTTLLERKRGWQTVRTHQTRLDKGGNSATAKVIPLIWFLLFAFCFCSQAQHAIDWHTIAGGGGTSTGATYQVSGTIGQPDAGSAMTGGQYSLTGGFWSLVAVVQTPGLPNLSIAHTADSVVVSWPNTAASTLQTNSNLITMSGWGAYSGTLSTANGTNSITISPPTRTLFFRLSK
jgi:hypothetical protein